MFTCWAWAPDACTSLSSWGRCPLGTIQSHSPVKILPALPALHGYLICARTLPYLAQG